MKKFLLALVILAGAGAAAFALLNKPQTDTVAQTDQQDDQARVISTSEGETAAAEGSVDGEAAGNADELRAKLLQALGEMPESAIKPAPIPGWYEVARGSAIGYVSEDARFLIDGDLIDLRTKTNLTDKRRSEWRQTTLAAIPEDQMIIFEPKKVKHTVTVFTDVDCGYCRKLHAEIDQYMAEGIRIRYVFYPLRGQNAKSYKTAENVWCSKDRQKAMTEAKLGKTIEAKACENPVAQHLDTGRKLGIRGTPGVVTEDGQLLPGYMPPKTLLSELDKGAQG